MKRVHTSVMLLIAIGGLFFIGCASMNEGKVTVTPLANKEYDIWSAGGLVSDRTKIINKWNEAADKTCNGKYKVTKEQTTGQSPAGTMTIEGRIRCE